MTMSHENAREIMLAAACGEAAPGQIEIAQRHVDACDECGPWRARLESLLSDLMDMAEDPPQQLDGTVCDLIRRGAPEDPWLLLWELADQIMDTTQVQFLRAAPHESAGRARREAAELTTEAGPRSLETLAREYFQCVETISAPSGARVFLAALNRDTWVGTILSDASVPLGGVPIRWASPSGRIQEHRTDARGSFVFEDDGQRPVTLTFGVPLATKHCLK